MKPALHEDTGFVFYMTKHKLPIMTKNYTGERDTAFTVYLQ